MFVFSVSFGVCFVCYAVRTTFNVARYRGSKIARKRSTVIFIYVVMAVLWFTWFQMCFLDPVRADLPSWAKYSGLALFIAGVSLFLMSHIHLGGLKKDNGLIKDGIYSKVRNPMYLGFIIWIIGFPLFTQSILALASSPIWIAHILTWKVFEERDLLRRHSDYAEYMRSTWF